MFLAILSMLFVGACGDDSEEAVGATDTRGEVQAIAYDGDLETGEPRRFRFWTHCGIEWLGRFNGEEWLLVGDDPPGQVPTSWEPHMSSSVDEEIVLQLELQESGRIEARPLEAPTDQAVEYQPTNEPNPGCD